MLYQGQQRLGAGPKTFYCFAACDVWNNNNSNINENVTSKYNFKRMYCDKMQRLRYNTALSQFHKIVTVFSYLNISKLASAVIASW